MNDFDPGLRAAIDDVWLDDAKEDMRQSIRKSLDRIDEGYFSEEELSFALCMDGTPHMDLSDDGLDAAVESDDPNAIDDYIASHPEVEEQAEAEERLRQAWLAAIDRQAMKRVMDTLPGLTREEAIEIIIAQRKEEIKRAVEFRQGAMEAVAGDGFSV